MTASSVDKKTSVQSKAEKPRDGRKQFWEEFFFRETVGAARRTKIRQLEAQDVWFARSLGTLRMAGSTWHNMATTWRQLTAFARTDTPSQEQVLQWIGGKLRRREIRLGTVSQYLFLVLNAARRLGLPWHDDQELKELGETAKRNYR